MTFSLASIQTSPRRRYARPMIYKGKFAERARDMCRAGAAADALTAQPVTHRNEDPARALRIAAPVLSPPQAPAPSRRIAPLIDADNVSHAKIVLILAELSKYGTANIRRAYGDWRSAGLKGWRDKRAARRSARRRSIRATTACATSPSCSRRSACSASTSARAATASSPTSATRRRVRRGDGDMAVAASIG